MKMAKDSFPFYIKLWPIFLSALSGQISSLINSILAGNYSTLDLAAVSYGFVMIIMMTSITQGGIEALIPYMQEMKKKEEYTKGIVTGFKAFLFYLLISIVIFLFFYNAVGFLGYTVEYENKIKSYLLPMFIFLIALQILSYLINILIINDSIKVIGAFGLIATLLDIITSSLFVFGYKFIPAMGATGAALGSMVGSLTVTMLAIAYIYHHKFIDFKAFWALLLKTKDNDYYHQFKNTVSAGLSSLVGRLILFTSILVMSFGLNPENNIASNQILSNMLSVFLIFSACSVKLFSNELSIRRIDNKGDIGYLISIGSSFLIIYALLSVFISLFYDNIINLYTNDVEVIKSLVKLLPIIIIYILCSVANVSLNSYFISKKQSKYIFQSQILTYLFFILAVFILFFVNRNISLNQVWGLVLVEKILQISMKFYLILKMHICIKNNT